MITVSEALDRILQTPLAIETERVPLLEAMGGILQSEVKGDRDLPPYDRITMDGIVIRYADFEKGQRTFAIQGVQAAGAAQQTLEKANSAIEIMTGASCPIDADTVIRYEDLEFIKEDGENIAATITVENVKARQNVHFQGTDSKKGQILLKPGRLIEAPEVAISASTGHTHLDIKRPPKMAIISTGDELVPIDQQPLPHQIRRSNGYMIKTAIKALGGEAETFHLLDDPETIKNEIKKIMAEYPVILLSGGVSKGKFDFVPQALEDLGVEKLFHKVKQRPGKPFWFGATASRSNVVFALPGNPVSAFVNFQRYFRPWLRMTLGGQPVENVFAKLKDDFHFKPDLTYFLQVKTTVDETGQVWAEPIEGHGSGDFANLLKVDSLLELPRGRDDFYAGESYPLFRFRI